MSGERVDRDELFRKWRDFVEGFLGYELPDDEAERAFLDNIALYEEGYFSPDAREV